MVDVLGNNIKNAFTGGVPVKAIYSNGVKVYPEDALPEEYTRVDYIYGDQKNSTSGVYGAGILITDVPWSKNSNILCNVRMEKYTVIDQQHIVGYHTGTYTYRSTTICSNDNGCFYINNNKFKTCSDSNGDEPSYYKMYYDDDTSKWKAYESQQYDYGTKMTLQIGVYDTYVGSTLLQHCETAVSAYDEARDDEVYKWDKITKADIAILNDYSSNTKEWYSSGCNSYIYGIKIYDGSSLTLNLVPAYRNSDSVAGLYDLVNNVFYTQDAGTSGSIHYGND